MRVTHLGHACLLVELADTRILVDPGSFSTGFESLRDLDAVVVTHQHADHLDEERLPDLLAFNRQAPVFADPDSAELLDGTSSDVVVLADGEEHRIGAATIRAVGKLHAVNHDAVPRCTNVGVVLQADGEPTLYHPGDAYDGEPGDVDVLAVPLNAPWARVAETIAFVRRVAPRQIVPIHDALLSEAGAGSTSDTSRATAATASPCTTSREAAPPTSPSTEPSRSLLRRNRVIQYGRIENRQGGEPCVDDPQPAAGEGSSMARRGSPRYGRRPTSPSTRFPTGRAANGHLVRAATADVVEVVPSISSPSPPMMPGPPDGDGRRYGRRIDLP